MNQQCPKCKEIIKAEQQGLFCPVCGYYEEPKSHEALRDRLNQKYEDGQNQIRSYLKDKLEKKHADTKQQKSS